MLRYMLSINKLFVPFLVQEILVTKMNQIRDKNQQRSHIIAALGVEGRAKAEVRANDNPPTNPRLTCFAIEEVAEF
jgi:hypothetical protein